MTAIRDTYKLVERWREAGVPQTQAGKMVEALNEELGQGVATKHDLAELELKIYKALIVQAFAIVGVVVALIKLL